MAESSTNWAAILLVGAAAGAAGYAVGAARATKRGERSSRDAYRRGLTEGHNKLAARHGRKQRMAKVSAPREQKRRERDTLPGPFPVGQLEAEQERRCERARAAWDAAYAALYG